MLAVALLHFVGDDRRPREALARYRDVLVPGSHLALSHASADIMPPARADDHVALYRRTATPMSMRPREEVIGFFDGFRLLEPGVVGIPFWRPDGSVPAGAERNPGYAGVGRRD